ncbi:unnamed protein product [Ophioblennius macclurei]
MSTVWTCVLLLDQSDMKLQTAAWWRNRGGASLHLLLVCCLLVANGGNAADVKVGSQTEARLKMSHAELRNGWGVFWEEGLSGGNQILLLMEDQGLLLVGGRDQVHLVRTDGSTGTAHKVQWEASRESVDHCLMAGKSPEGDCANFVRLLQPINKTSVFACGTGAFYPQCTFLQLSADAQEPSLTLSHVSESGRGKCPFSPREPFAAVLTEDGHLYSGTSVDFMGVNSGIFRTSVGGLSASPPIRSEAYDHNWFHEPDFVASFSVPDTQSPDDDKVYLFFRERALEAGQWDQKVYSRVARVCKNDVGGKRSLINRWTTFLKTRLVCSVPGESELDTHFDLLEDVFRLETKDPHNPTFYGVFSTSSSVFRGSAVCVFSMSSIRAAFNGPFAHREGPDHRWVEYKGRIPYPRPGTCPSETYDALFRSTQDFPDEVVSFMRQHQLMWDPVLPLGSRPVFTRVNSPSTITKVVVDRVDAEDGPYDVLHLGTDDGKVLKVVSVPKGDQDWEQIVLEELAVFQNPTPILNMVLSTKRQHLYVSSDVGVAQLGLQRCSLYGSDCAECCLSRDPYCAWDGQTCSRFFPTSKRRARRQDVKYGDPWSQCPLTEDALTSVEVKEVFGVEGNSSFLECSARSPQAERRWKVQLSDDLEMLSGLDQSAELPLSPSPRFLQMNHGLLVQLLEPSDSGVYTCSAHERSYSQVLTRYRLHVVPSTGLRAGRYLQPQQARSYKELWSADQYCEQLWYRQKRRQQKLRALKLKQEGRKARVRRNNPSSPPL